MSFSQWILKFKYQHFATVVGYFHHGGDMTQKTVGYTEFHLYKNGFGNRKLKTNNVALDPTYESIFRKYPNDLKVKHFVFNRYIKSWLMGDDNVYFKDSNAYFKDFRANHVPHHDNVSKEYFESKKENSTSNVVPFNKK